jgi:hypothetical protein
MQWKLLVKLNLNLPDFLEEKGSLRKRKKGKAIPVSGRGGP